MASNVSIDNLRPAARSLSLQSALLAGLAGGVISAVLNVILLLVAQNALAMNIQVPMGPGGPLVPLGAGQVAFVSVLPGLAAGFLLWLLAKFSSRGRTIFMVIAALFLLVSFLPLVSLPELAGGTNVILGVMHVLSAAAIVGALIRR